MDNSTIDIQRILTILDTIHDYGDTGRVKSVIGKKLDTQEFNPAFIIDFLMLGYVHNDFRQIMGLWENKHYLREKDDCNNTKYFNSGKFKPIVTKLCEDFYFPTYAEKIIYRSPNPEDISKQILYTYLKDQNVIYEEKQINIQDYLQEGKFEPQEDWINYVNGKTCVRLTLGNTTQFTGLYNIEETNNQNTILYNYLKTFFNCNHLTYITDANKLNILNKVWYCVDGVNETHYRGTFTKYDSFKQNNTNMSGGMPPRERFSSARRNAPPPKNDRILPAKNIKPIEVAPPKVYNCVLKEFQDYSLDKSAGELLRINRLYYVHDEQKLKHEIEATNKIISRDIDLDQPNKPKTSNKDRRGLSLFLLLFNEINKKSLGYADFNKGDAKSKNLKEDINKIGYESLKTTYKVGLELIEESTSGYTLLKPTDFVLTLFDLKRSMDYLYVKASSTANKSDEAKTNNIKYVFVSSDRSAILYSLLLNNPCILTPPVTKDGDHNIILYNPLVDKKKNNGKPQNDNNAQARNSKKLQNDIPQIMPQNAQAQVERNRRTVRSFLKAAKIDDLDKDVTPVPKYFGTFNFSSGI
jgi:hypothetical protein